MKLAPEKWWESEAVRQAQALRSVGALAFGYCANAPRRELLQTTPALLFLPHMQPKDDEGLEHEPGFIATLGGQRDELVRSLIPFIAVRVS